MPPTVVVAIDPGCLESARVVYNGVAVCEHAITSNEDLRLWLNDHKAPGLVLVLEEVQMFASHGVGKTVFDSVFWSGRFVERWFPYKWDRMFRTQVRAHLCHTMKSGDAQVRQALIARFGPYEEQAIGKKAAPGPLYGLKSHEWQALGLAVAWYDKHGHEPAPGDPVRPGVDADWK